MAYSSVTSVRRVGQKGWLVEINETDAGSSSETQITRNSSGTSSGRAVVPAVGRVIRQTCILVSGTGSTVQPILGTVSNPSGTDIIVQVQTADSQCDTQGSASYATEVDLEEAKPIKRGLAVLYHRSNVNSGTDNVIKTTYHIIEDWTD